MGSDGDKLGERGSIFKPLGTLTEVLLTGMLSPSSLTSLLEKELPRLVLLAEIILVSTGETSSWMEDLLLPARRGNTFLGSYYLKDFFLVC